MARNLFFAQLSNRPIFRLSALLTALSLASGCASRAVYFTSKPYGAEVQVGRCYGTTPCTLKIPQGEKVAIFTLDSGAQMTLPLPLKELDNGLETACRYTGRVTGGMLMVVGGTALATGVLLIYFATDVNRDDPDPPHLEKDHKDWDAIGIGAGLMLLGGGVFTVGAWMSPENEAPQLHAEFAGPSD